MRRTPRSDSVFALPCLSFAIPRSPKMVTVFLLISVNTSWMLTELVHYNDKINTAWYCSPSVNMHRSKFDANANSCSVITSYWVFKANVFSPMCLFSAVFRRNVCSTHIYELWCIGWLINWLIKLIKWWMDGWVEESPWGHKGQPVSLSFTAYACTP